MSQETLTPTLGPVTPTRTKTPEVADRAEEAPTAKAAAVVEIAQLLNIYLKEKLKMVAFPNS